MLIPAAPFPRQTPVIAGPTAGGKSDLAVELAIALREQRGLAAEIITADAFQVYRGMDIGTAKPMMDERRGVPHHLIDLVSPSQREGAGGRVAASRPASESDDTPRARDSGALLSIFTVEDWLTLATAKVAELREAGKLPIVVGGTHLYIKALLDGLFQGPEPDPALRAELNAMDPAARRAELEHVDPAAAARIHPNDIRRTVRALEVFRQTGRPISEHQRQWDATGGEPGSRGSGFGPEEPGTQTRDPKPEPRFRLVILDWETEALNRRINARVKQMMEQGLLDELRRLTERGPMLPQAAEALGYKQLLPLLAPGRPWPPRTAELEDAIERIKIETRRYGKNQRTWLKRLRNTPGSLSITCPPPPGAEAVKVILTQLAHPKW